MAAMVLSVNETKAMKKVTKKDIIAELDAMEQAFNGEYHVDDYWWDFEDTMDQFFAERDDKEQYMTVIEGLGCFDPTKFPEIHFQSKLKHGNREDGYAAAVETARRVLDTIVE